MAIFSFRRKEIQKRDAVIPEKIYIEREGEYNNYFDIDSTGLKQKLDELLHGTYSSRNFIELFYSLPEVFAPVHEIASRVADANWELRKSWNDEVDYNDADFNRLFTSPNPLMNFKQFVYQSVCYEILTGKQFWYFNRSSLFEEKYKGIITWWNLPAHAVLAEVKETSDVYTATSLNDFVSRWKCASGNKLRIFETADVIPMLNLDLVRGIDVNRTRSYLIGAEKAIRNLLPVYEARGIIYIKRGAMGFLVSAKKDADGTKALTVGEKKDIRKEVNGTYGLTGGRDTIGVTDQPLDFVKTSMTIQEMLPFEETLADALAIYKTLRVPRHLAPNKDNSTFANADSDLKSFYDDVIIPWGKRLAQVWTAYMGFNSNRRYIYANFDHINVLKGNQKDKSVIERTNGQTWLERWRSSACSLNEWIAANNGLKGTGPLFEKKLLEMTPEEIIQVEIILKNKPNDVTGQNQGTQTTVPAN